VSGVPPVALLYHKILLPVDVAVRLVEVPLHIVLALVETGGATGSGFIFTAAVSLHPFGAVHTKLYTPPAVRFDIVGVVLVVELIVATAGLDANADHTPPVTAIDERVAGEPGSITQFCV
jgi:hypothetical protein